MGITHQRLEPGKLSLRDEDDLRTFLQLAYEQADPRTGQFEEQVGRRILYEHFSLAKHARAVPNVLKRFITRGILVRVSPQVLAIPEGPLHELWAECGIPSTRKIARRAKATRQKVVELPKRPRVTALSRTRESLQGLYARRANLNSTLQLLRDELQTVEREIFIREKAEG